MSSVTSSRERKSEVLTSRKACRPSTGRSLTAPGSASMRTRHLVDLHTETISLRRSPLMRGMAMMISEMPFFSTRSGMSSTSPSTGMPHTRRPRFSGIVVHKGDRRAGEVPPLLTGARRVSAALARADDEHAVVLRVAAAGEVGLAADLPAKARARPPAENRRCRSEKTASAASSRRTRGCIQAPRPWPRRTKTSAGTALAPPA